MQGVYPKPELLELSEYLIPNGAWLKLPSRFKKPFQFPFHFLHPNTPTRIFENLCSTNGRREPSGCASVPQLYRTSPPLIQPRVANRYHLKQSIAFSSAILGIAD